MKQLTIILSIIILVASCSTSAKSVRTNRNNSTAQVESPIEYENLPYIETSRENVATVRERFASSITIISSTTSASGVVYGTLRIGGGGSEVAPAGARIPYNPIEL